MKTFIGRIILFFVCVAVVDRVVGYGCDYINSHPKGGDSKAHYDAFNTVTADVIVLGSSRARHHYNPSIIEDSLGLKCYNCGYDGNGIFNMYGRLTSICQRKAPQIVLYDVYAPNELYDLDNLRDLEGIKRYCENDSIASIIKDVAPMEKYKLFSFLYRYNTNIFQMVSDYIHISPIDKQGYSPLGDKVIDYEPEPFHSSYIEASPDSKKMQYLNKMVYLSKRYGFKLFFCISPRLNANSDEDYKPLIEFCKNNNVSLLNFYMFDMISKNKNLFKDPVHLNTNGADIYTKEIVYSIKGDM